MSDSRMISLDEFNQLIDEKIKEYENSAEDAIQEYSDEERGNELLAKAHALGELKIEINEPKEIVNVSENVQQTSNVITTQNIVNDGL
jgi:hypothetical protein